jgi:hypothetical protein
MNKKKRRPQFGCLFFMFDRGSAVNRFLSSIWQSLIRSPLRPDFPALHPKQLHWPLKVRSVPLR